MHRRNAWNSCWMQRSGWMIHVEPIHSLLFLFKTENLISCAFGWKPVLVFKAIFHLPTVHTPNVLTLRLRWKSPTQHSCTGDVSDHLNQLSFILSSLPFTLSTSFVPSMYTSFRQAVTVMSPMESSSPLSTTFPKITSVMHPEVLDQPNTGKMRGRRGGVGWGAERKTPLLL